MIPEEQPEDGRTPEELIGLFVLRARVGKEWVDHFLRCSKYNHFNSKKPTAAAVFAKRKQANDALRTIQDNDMNFFKKRSQLQVFQIDKYVSKLIYQRARIMTLETKETEGDEIGLVTIVSSPSHSVYGVSTRAQNEADFLAEFCKQLGDDRTAKEIAGLLPLAIELCVKYRGYKSESVVERRELVVGDLVLPKPANNE